MKPASANSGTVTTDVVAGTFRPVAVIDIGASSIRMAIAEIASSGIVRPLERLVQGVSLGKDTFARRYIRKSTIEGCVRVLRSYREKLSEYGIKPEHVRVVATSAVREAANRMTFLDRIYSATGFQVDAIDEAEVSRATFLGVQPLIKADPRLSAVTSVIVEVGGGSTDVLILRDGDVVHSHTYRLGSLRLREMLLSHHAPKVQSRHIMEVQINRTVEQIREQTPDSDAIELVAIGGDVRFAAAQLQPEQRPEEFGRIAIADFEAFANRMLALSEDQIVQKYHLNPSDAETLGPALLTYVRMAREFRLQHIVITDFNLRDALLTEMAVQDPWSDDLRDQIIRSAIDLGRKFDFDESHSHQVARLSRLLFNELQPQHELDSRWELVLYLAALLHEVGLFVSGNSYHKHSLYLITNSELFGLGKTELLLVALIARYHRRASPKPGHEGFSTLVRNDRIAVSKMAAILRLADALDHSRSQRIQDLRCEIEGKRIVIWVSGAEDLAIEQLGLSQKGTLFEETYGLDVLLRRQRN